jgi:hypothetical protein
VTSLPDLPSKSFAPRATATENGERARQLASRSGPLSNLERRWAVALLSAFAPSGARGLAPREGEVDYLSTAQQMLRASTPLAAVALRAAVWMAALAPLWLWGRFKTVLDLDAASRTRLLTQLVSHRGFAVRELTMLLKLAAAMALLGTPSIRQRSGYDNVQAVEKIESGIRRKLPLLAPGESDPDELVRNDEVA